MSLFLSALAPVWQWVAGALAGLAAIAGIYLKGRSDAKAKAKLEDVTNANEIRRKGADARASVSDDKLHDNDGWQRRD